MGLKSDIDCASEWAALNPSTNKNIDEWYSYMLETSIGPLDPTPNDQGSNGIPCRPCGECSECCFGRFEAATVMCTHLTEKGCGAHSVKPIHCRIFNCLWSEGTLPEWMHPSKCGVQANHIIYDDHEVILAQCTSNVTPEMRAELERVARDRGAIVEYQQSAPRLIVNEYFTLQRFDPQNSTVVNK